jgi:hypothetical protein
VQPFPLTGAKWQVSTGGGRDPRWNPNGKEIFYISPDQKLMAATVRANGPNFEVDPPKTLFQSRLFGPAGIALQLGHKYSVSPDGQRFLMIIAAQEQTPAPITVVVNWTAGLKK